MSLTSLQYILIVALVICTGYFLYLLKQKCRNIDEDYYGITFSMLDSLHGKDVTTDNIKKILRIVSENVNYIEYNSNNMLNSTKEDLALSRIKEYLVNLNMNNSINDENIRCLIRLSCGFMLKNDAES